MLKFFRKIRQKLLSENRFSKYLIYAIGEIFLVVIGILIALQINNWNEEGKNRITEKKVLTAILENLEEDKVILNRVQERYELTTLNIQRFFSSRPIPDDSIAFIATRAVGIANFIPITAAFDRSMNSGNFNYIKNDSLAQSIQRFYSFDYRALDDSHKNLMKFQNSIKDLTTLYDAFELKPLNRDEGIYDKDYVLPWNIKNLKKRNESKEFRSLLKQINVGVHMIRRSYEKLEVKNDLLRKRIESYLKTF